MRSTEEVDRVLVVPTFKHPFAKALAPFDERVTMCELAMAWMPGVAISRVEEELGGESRRRCARSRVWRERSPGLAAPPRHRRGHPGQEAPPSVDSGFEAIEKLAPPIVLGRAGFARDGRARRCCLPEVSSTQVRSAIARGAWSDVEKIVPRAVLAHVRARGLYAAPE